MSINNAPRLLALTAALTVGAAFVPTAASAASALRTDIVVNALFTIADANGDGKIDAAEAAALREQRFDDLDANHDGVIDPTEIGRLQQRAENRTKLLEDIVRARFTELDADGNGTVSKQEYMNAPQGVLSILADSDGDGAISKDEIARVMAALAAR